MKNQYPVKFVARALIKDGRTLGYFPSMAFIKETLKEQDAEFETMHTKYHIEYCEKFDDDIIENYPYQTGYYYGKVFDDEKACQDYVDAINKRLPFYNKAELAALKALRSQTANEPTTE